MKQSDVHHHILKTLYKVNSVVLFFLGLYLTVRFEVENWNTRRIVALINNPMEVFCRSTCDSRWFLLLV